MPGSPRNPRTPILALAAVLLVLGAALLGTSSFGVQVTDALPGPLGDDATTPAATPSPGATGHTAASRGGSRSASPSATPKAASSLDSAVTQRQAELRKLAKQAQRLSRQRLTARPVSDIVFATFNVQGASHRGDVGGRMARTRDLLNRYRVDVVSLQEFQRSQRGIFSRIAGGTYAVYPGTQGRSLDAENSVAWRRDRFDLVRGETRPYPYFKGAVRNMPRVLLRDKRTGTRFWVTSYHNPATCCGYGNAAGFRARAVGAQVADANALVRDYHQPIIVAGDMNDRAAYFCRMAGGTGMHSADGSTHAGGCRVARGPWIDWVMGTPDVAFSGYVRDRSGFVRRTSDHPIVVTHARITGKAGDGQDAGG